MKQFPSPLAVESRSKVNLYLQVLNKRKDNFHNLSTLFARIDLADTISFRNRKDDAIKIKCNSRQVPCDETNLCYQAAQLLKQEFRLGFGLEIKIKKRIPVGAGLGGGSSNAASTLIGLNKYWNLNLSKAKLAKLAAKLGSDVAFFIYDTTFATAAGRGDKISPIASLDKLKLWFILVYPNIKVSTPLIYRKFDEFSRLAPTPTGKEALKKQLVWGLTMPSRNVKILTSELSKKGKGINQDCLFNSLEAVTTGLYPVVNQVKKALSNIGLDKVMMSGSGPVVFAICNSRTHAQGLSKKLQKKYKSWAVFVSSTV